MRQAWLLRPAGPVGYDRANEAMHALAERRLAGEIADTVLLLEHPPVFTAGRRARASELLRSERELGARGATVRRIDRGGAFTFHGPGQLVGYPIVDLGPRPDVGAYLRRIEDAVVDACADLGARVEARPDIQTGVWAGDRKVCAIGIRLLRTRITLHGFALNCDVDLAWFDAIVPCGLPEHPATSLTAELGRVIGVDETRPWVERRLAERLDVRFVPAPADVAAMLPDVARV